MEKRGSSNKDEIASKLHSTLKSQVTGAEALEPEDLRERIALVLKSERYQRFIVIVILISAIQLGLDSPLVDPQSTKARALFWLDIITILVFTAEGVLKIFANGFLLRGQKSYLRSQWNILDLFILIVSYICLVPSLEKFKIIKSLRILRSLRIISRNEGLRVAVRALFYAIPNIASITTIMLLFFLIFAVIAVSFFKGKAYFCTQLLEEANAFPSLDSMWDCLDQGGVWTQRVYNFDNVPSAMVTLFVMSTTAGWGEIMTSIIETSEINMAHLEGQRNIYWVLFFVIFMIVGCFFFLNLFIGVVINTFHQEEERVGGSELLTEKQKEYIDLRLLVLRSEPIKKVKAPE